MLIVQNVWHFNVRNTLHTVNKSDIALRPMFAATITSSCLPLFPAETAFAVAIVIGFVQRTNSSAVAVDFIASFEFKALKYAIKLIKTYESINKTIYVKFSINF